MPSLNAHACDTDLKVRSLMGMSVKLCKVKSAKSSSNLIIFSLRNNFYFIKSSEAARANPYNLRQNLG